jgi:hypothetical protein
VAADLSALRSACIDGGFPLDVFSDPRISRLLLGMAHAAPPPRPPRPTRQPISGPLLFRLIGSLPPSSPLERSLRAALALGFFGLMRAGEFCFKGHPHGVLLRQHVSWYDSYVSILLAQSKTDRSRRGVSVRLHRSSFSICPVALLSEAWWASPVQAPGAPLLQDDKGDPLTYRTVLYFIKQRVREFGLDPTSFGAHSLRIGGTSQLAAANFSPTQIQALGRWSSACYERYVRLPASLFQQVAASLGSSCSSTYGPAAPSSQQVWSQLS